MGMFDYVKYTAPCTACGEPMTKWQTKSTPDPSLDTVTPDQIIGGEFYESCPKCKTWNEYRVRGIGYAIEPTGGR